MPTLGNIKGSGNSKMLISATDRETQPKRVQQNGIAIAIFAIALLLRVWAIATPLNTDEAKWLSRGAEFIHHLFAGNWGDTYTTPHPGVPNMWVIGLGMEFNRQLGNGLGQWLNGGQMPQALLFPDTLFPIHWYILPRVIQALISSLCMVGFYKLTGRLFGNTIALLATVLLLFEPFFLSYQRFITTDALQTNFGILGLLGWVYYFQRQYFQRSPEAAQTLETSNSNRVLWLFSGECWDWRSPPNSSPCWPSQDCCYGSSS